MNSRPGVLTVARLRKRRIIMLWISLPIVVAVLTLAVLLLNLAPTAQQAIDAFDEGRYTASGETSASLLSPNLVEKWLPYFNRGDAYAADGDYGKATEDFERSLELAPLQRQCEIRLNLALTWERFGDIYVANGFYQGAVQLYAASQAVLDAAGPECDPPEKKQRLTEANDRVAAKKEFAEQQRDQQRPPNQSGDGDEGSRLDDLQRQQGQADQEKADRQAQESEDRGGAGIGRVPKPW